MASILGNIEKAMTTAPTKLRSEQAENERILKAAGGRAGASTGPRTSTLAENVELAQADAAKDVALTQGKQQFSALKTEETRVNAAFSEAQNKVIKDYETVSKSINSKVDSIIQSAKFQRQELSFQKEQAKVEEAGFLLRLQNDKYVQNLNIEARRARFADQLSFSEASAQTVLGREFSAKMEELGFTSIMNATKREQDVILAGMSAEQAYALAQASMKDENSRAAITAATNIVTGYVNNMPADTLATPTAASTSQFATGSEAAQGFSTTPSNPLLDQYLTPQAGTTTVSSPNAAGPTTGPRIK